MARMGYCAAVVTMTLLVVVANASDPELTTDFFVAVGVNKTTLTADYFTDITLRNGVTIVPPAKFGAKKVNSESFPVLTGLGVSTALLAFLPGGINPPHTHPRGTEVLAVVDGELTVGLIDSTNKLFTKVLTKSDIFVFPRGLVHFQINLGSKPVEAYAAFSSSNPGTVSLPANLFGSGIANNILQAAFKVSGQVIDQLEAPFKK